METNAKETIPFVATHPGTILHRELKERGIKQKEFAVSLDMRPSHLNELIHGKRQISSSTAIKLEQLLGIPYQTWMNLQSQYLYVIEKRAAIDKMEEQSLVEEASLDQRINMKSLYVYYNIDETLCQERLKKIKSQLPLDLNMLHTLEVNTCGFFKRSTKLKIDERNMRTWLLIAWSQARKAETSTEYVKGNANLAASEISKIANSDGLTIAKLQDILNRYGIIYLYVPKLDYAPIDAYSTYVGKHPVVVVTYRHNDIDKLAFDVLHELGHIALHLNSNKSHIKIEFGDNTLSNEEIEADNFAKDHLIPSDIWQSIVNSPSKCLSPHEIAKTIATAAINHGISPSIAVARFKHDEQCYNIKHFRSRKIY